MRRVFQTISWISLAVTGLAPLLFYTGSLGLEQSKMILLIATFGWFVHTPLWMGRETP
jgi:hypothetical protein